MKFRMAMALSVAVLLGGCWGGDFAQLPEDELVAPPVSGDFTRVSTPGAEQKRYRGTANGVSLAVESFENGAWKEDAPTRFVSLGGSFYLAESGVLDTELFLMETLAGGGFKLHILECDDEALALSSVSFDEESEYCLFNDYAELKAEAAKVAVQIRAGNMYRVFNSEEYRPTS